MILLDGSYKNGGGQILRTALALSTLTQKPFIMKNIRLQRPNPGLKAQHMTCINTLQKLCEGQKTQGTSIKSSEIKFIPGIYKAKNCEIDIGTAGSIPLLLQSILLPSIFSDKKHSITIKGGTDVKWSMTIDYFKEVIIPQLKRFCNEIKILTKKRGYYPKGGGIVEIRINPSIKRNSFENFEDFKKTIKSLINIYSLKGKTKLLSIDGTINISSNQNIEILNRIEKAMKSKLSIFNTPINIQKEQSNTISEGTSITIWAKCKTKREFDTDNPIIIGADQIGEKNSSPEEIGQIAAEKLIKEIESKKCVDEHLADNLIPAMALLPGSQIETSRISNHTKSNIYAVEQFIGKIFEIKENIIKTKYQ
jgi:RNA 3'-phosphate cyclase